MWAVLTNVFQDWTRAQMRRIARVFVKTPITPNMLTVFGLFLNIGVAPSSRAVTCRSAAC